MLEVTYYFNAYITPVWDNPDNLIDGDIGTFASTGAKGTAQTLTGNDCPGTDLGTIIKVELRLYGKGDGDDRIDITPVFAGGNGDTHQTTPVVSPGGWVAYVDITNDPNHPDWSLWSHIQDLDCIINSVAVAKGNTLYCAKVEVRVTWTIPWEPPVSDIDVGADPVDRTGYLPYGYTRVDKSNPANASGMLHSVKVYAHENITGLIVGTFYLTNGNTLKCRDSALVGDVEAGAERTFTGLSIRVEEGDYIGGYFTYGFIDRETTGFSGMWSVLGEYIDPGDEAEYTFYEGDAISLYGYGDFWTPPVSDIDVGAEPIDRTTTWDSGYTIVDKNNPANASGVLHSIKVHAYANMTGLIVGTFYTTDGNTLKCRDSELIGDVVAGEERTFTELSIIVEEGDYIGCYFTDGFIDRDMAGFSGIWWIFSECIDPNDEATYGFYDGDAMSLYGYGDIEAPPPAVVSGGISSNRETEQGSILTNRNLERPGVLSNVESPGGSIFSNVGDERSAIRSGRA